jgi:(p)ppGpp synthase/HD superfamily hydrolase
MKLEKEHIELALKMAKKYHSGQSDRGGTPYINHILRVFKGVGGYNSTPIELGIVALLHDIVEDTPIKIGDIYKLFGDTVGDAVKAITKDGSSNQSYLNKVKGNRIARAVKIADMVDNSNIKRIPNPTEDDYDRVQKYKESIKFLR